MAELLTPVRLGTVQNVNLSVPLNLGNDKIDGVIVVEGMRILVKAQTNRIENGVYVAQNTGYLIRATDFNNGNSIVCGTAVFIQEGVLLENTGWLVNLYDESNATTLLVGTDKILFERFTVNLNLDAADISSAIILRSVKGYPLTIAELDNNFKWLATTMNQKLNISDFNPLNIVSKINSLTAAEANLDAWRLRGLSARADVIVPYEGPAGTADIPIRDELGDIYANRFRGDLKGRADIATLADFATLAGNVTGIVAVANGGTGASTGASARINLRVLGIDGDEAMVGKLKLSESTNVRASLNIPPSIDPTTPIQGDIWATSSYLRYYLNGVKHSIAHINSPAFTGVPTVPTSVKAMNSTQIASTEFVHLHVTDINAALALKAPLASPALTGNPTAPTQAINNVSTRLANTEFVKNKLDAALLGYYTKPEIDLMNASINQTRADADENLQNQLNEMKHTIGLPVGSIVYYSANSVPVGFLLCDGRAISKVTYPILFNAIRYTYGGSGNNFNLPDLRGEFIRGHDAGRGVDAGRVFGSWQRGSIVPYDPSRTSLSPAGMSAINDYTSSDGKAAQVQKGGFDIADHSLYTQTVLNYASSGGTFVGATNAGGWEVGVTRPRNVALLPCIKAFGDIDNPDQINATAVLQTILNKINRDGDTMTNFLSLHADPTSDMHSVTKQYVDNRQDKWGTSRKFIQSTEPISAVDGDIWFKI